MTRPNIEVQRTVISPEELKEMGYESVSDMLRTKVTANSTGYYDSYNGKNSLNVGLSEEGRQVFREARQRVLANKSILDLIAELSVD